MALPYPHGTGSGQIGNGANIDIGETPGSTGGKFIGFGEEGTSAIANRAHYALSANIDYIYQGTSGKLLAAPAGAAFTSAGQATYQIIGTVWCGDSTYPGTAGVYNNDYYEGMSLLFEITDSLFNPIVVGDDEVQVARVRDATNVTDVYKTGFVVDPVITFQLRDPNTGTVVTYPYTIPALQEVRVIHGAQYTIETLPEDALVRYHFQDADVVPAGVVLQDGTRPMTGDFDLDDNDIINGDTINSKNFIASGATAAVPGGSFTGGPTSSGVVAQGTGASGYGVYATGGTSAYGVFGRGGSASGAGVHGLGIAAAATGVSGTGGPTSGKGVVGLGTGTGTGGDFTGGSSGGPTTGVGVRGTGGGQGRGVVGEGGTNATGVVGLGGSTNGKGGEFIGQGSGDGINATGGATGRGVYGEGSGAMAGVHGKGGSAGGQGVYGESSVGYGVHGVGAAIGVYGDAGTGAGVGISAEGGDTNGLGLSAYGGGTTSYRIGTGIGAKVYGASAAVGAQISGGYTPLVPTNPFNGTGIGTLTFTIEIIDDVQINGAFTAGDKTLDQAVIEINAAGPRTVCYKALATGAPDAAGTYIAFRDGGGTPTNGSYVRVVYSPTTAWTNLGFTGTSDLETGGQTGLTVYGGSGANAITAIASIDGDGIFAAGGLQGNGAHGYCYGTGAGVRGESTSGYGVYGTSGSSIGMVGDSFSLDADKEVYIPVPLGLGIADPDYWKPVPPALAFTENTSWVCKMDGTYGLYFEVGVTQGFEARYIYVDWENADQASGKLTLDAFKLTRSATGAATKASLGTQLVATADNDRHQQSFACTTNNTGFEYQTSTEMTTIAIYITSAQQDDQVYGLFIGGHTRSVCAYSNGEDAGA